MNTKKNVNTPTAPKPGVTFKDQKPASSQQSDRNQKKISSQYKDANYCKNNAIETFNEADRCFKLYTKNDPEVKRKDTAKALLKILNSIKEAMDLMNFGTYEDKMMNYYLTFNGSVYIYDICQFLRRSVYSSLTINFLACAITSLECHLILIGVKFLEWRIKLYIELAQVYEECGSLLPASRTIEVAMKKVQELKELEETDPPLPDYIAKIFEKTLRLLKVQDVKFKLQNGGLQGDAFKKRIEEYFGNDKKGKILAIVESLRINNSKNYNIVQNEGKNLSWKQTALIASYEMIKGDLEIITKSLIEANEKIERISDFRSKTLNCTEDEKKELTLKNREIDKICIKEKVWKQASENFPLEFHIELVKSAYDAGNAQIFEELSKAAMIRCKFRRMEVPFISDIKIVKDISQNPNILNGEEKIPYDLNEADLKLELAKLRNKSDQTKKENENKDNKDKASAKTDKKTDKNKKDINLVEAEENPIATESELQKIGHEYVYIFIKRSVNPEKAIYDLNIIMDDEEIKSTDPSFNYIFVPIKQYTGVRETTHKVPYICYRHSKEYLKDDEEKKTLLIDLEPLPGKHPLIRANFGFEKIDVDLRQVPKEFIKLPNMDYVYLTKKTDKEFFNNERELQLLMNLYELEKSYGINKVANLEDEKKLELDFNYDMKSIKVLIKSIKSCLEGPLGQQFYIERKDFLMQLAIYVWNKYFVSQLYQIEQIHELRISKEIRDDQYEQYKTIIGDNSDILLEGMKNILSILMKNEKTDIILLSKITLELTKMLEVKEEFTLATQTLDSCLIRINDFRNKALLRGAVSKCDKFLPHSLTCSNESIRSTVKKLKERYIDVKNQINREIRAKEKEANNRPELLPEEAKEEEYEILHACKTFLNEDNKDSNYFETIDISTKPIKELDLIINSLHSELTANYIRCQLKAGKALLKKNKIKATTIKNMEKTGDPNALIFKNDYKGIAQNIKAKMDIMSGPSSTLVKKNALQLQNNLQNAGKLEPSKPKPESYEEDLIKKGHKNTYFNAILYMMMASNKTKLPEQKYLLNKSFEYIVECEKTESTFLQGLIDDSIFVISTLLDDILQGPKYSHSVFPFSYLYNPQYIIESIAPRKPILISKNSNSITLKLPPFNPKLEQTPYIEPEKKVIESMSLFGSESNNRDIQPSSTTLQNTGVRNELGSILTVGGLTENEHYSFAVAAYNANQDMSNDKIGETLHEIGTYHPIPITLLYAYLAKIAYQIGDFDTSYKAAEKNSLFYMELSEIADRYLDLPENPVTIWRIVQSKLQDVSIIDLRYLTESFIIMARCTQKKNKELEAQPKVKSSLTLIAKQKNDLKISNFLLMALETCFLSCDYITLKKVVFEIYNNIIPLLEMRTKSHLLLQIVLKSLMAVSEIPKQIWDDNLRSVSCKLTYELITMGFQMNELNLNKRIIFTQIKLPLKKFFTVSKIIMIPEETVSSKEEKKAQNKNVKKPPNPPKEAQKQEKESKEAAPEIKMVPKIIREIMSKNSLQGYLEECLSMYSEDFSDFLQNFIETWKEQLDSLAGFLEGDLESIDKLKAELSLKIDFWELCKDLPNAVTKLQATYKASPYYLEFFCKIIRRTIESGAVDIKQISEQCNQFAFQNNNEAFQLLISEKEMRLEAIKNDIDWHPLVVSLLKKEKETNKIGEDKAIELFDAFLIADIKLSNEIAKNPIEYVYENIWRAELFFLRATAKYLTRYLSVKEFPESQAIVYFDITKIDKESFLQLIQETNRQAVIDQNLMTLLSYVLKNLGESCYHSYQAKSLIQFQNNLKFLNNLLINEMLNPFMHQGTDLWTHLSFICMMINEMLLYIKNMQSNTTIESKDNDGKISEENPNKFEEKKENAEYPKLDDTLTKDFWFKQKKQIDIQTIANIMAYTVSTLFLEEKWSILVLLVRNFSNITTHCYSTNLVPFLVHAQNIKLAQAKEKTEQKKQELEKRIEDYKKWESKTKKTRQTKLLSGEIPQEKIDFEKDSNEFKRQIEMYTSKENFIKGNKELAEKVLSIINRDANKVLENLQQMRKELLKFGNHDKQLHLEEIDEKDENVKKKKKNHIIYGLNLVKQYKNDVIEVLGKRQEKSEKFILVQALNELGNLYFSINKFSEAEGIWNDSLDAIFQKLFSLKQWRKIFNESSLISFQYGFQQCLVGCILLNKLSSICYFNNIHLQRESIFMAAELAFSVFKISLPHPQILIKYGDYRLKELLKNEEVFSNRETLDPIESLLSFENLSWMLIDYNSFLKSLPMLTLMEYISTEILQNSYYSVRSKILKSIAMSQISLINESLQMLIIVANEKNLPVNWLRESEFLKKEKGSNWFNNSNFMIQNEIPFYDDKNKEQIENIFNIELPKNFWKKYGLLNISYFKYAKGLLLFNLHQTDVFEKQETNEMRINTLKRIEVQLRQLLKTISNEEELTFLLNEYEIFKYKSKLTLNPETEKLQTEKQKILSFMAVCGFDPSDHEYLFSLKEESLSYFETKQLRISLMIRVRLLLSQINFSMNFYTRSYYILKHALSNLMLYSYENHLVETGEEPENPQVEVRTAETDKKKPAGAAAAGKVDPKKAAQQAKDEEEKKMNEEKKKNDLAKQSEMKIIAEGNRYRRTVNGFWWIKLRYELALILFYQRKYDDCLEMVAKIQEESKILKDAFFLRLSNEIQAKIFIKKGQFKNAIEKFDAFEKDIKENSYSDIQLAVFYGDFGEIFFEKNEFEKSLHLFEDSQRLLESYLKEVGYDANPPNKNSKALNENIKVSDKLMISPENEQDILRKPEAKLKGKKDEKKNPVKDEKGKKDAKKKAAENEIVPLKFNPLIPLSNNDFSKEIKINFHDFDVVINNTEFKHNCFVKHLEIYIKASLRSIHTWMHLHSSEIYNDSILANLKKIEVIIGKNFNIPTSSSLLLNFLMAKYYKKKFIEALIEIQTRYISKYTNEKIKKYKRLADRLPFRDLARNKYLLDLPNFSQKLKEEIIPLIKASKDYLFKCLTTAKGECLFFENSFKVEEVFFELSEVCLFMREYRPRIRYNYIEINELEIKYKNIKNSNSENFIEEKLSKQEALDQLDQKNLELEAYSYLNFALQISDAKKEITENFSSLGLTKLTDISKVPPDIMLEIMEQDYLYKKNYDPKLFDENKKKTSINSIDLITYMSKLARESKILTFSDPKLQKTLSKLHRYLKFYLPSYAQKCVINSFDFALKTDIKTVFIPEGTVICRSSYNSLTKEYKFIYILGGLNKEKIVSALNQEEINKIIMNEEKDVLYGNIYMNAEYLDKLQREAFNLKSRMLDSEQKSQTAKTRDFKYHIKDFRKLFEDFGKFFYLKEVNLKHPKKPKGRAASVGFANDEEESNIDALDKHVAFIPDLTFESIQVMIDLLNEKGLNIINQNYLAIFRFFHHIKYDHYKPK